MMMMLEKTERYGGFVCLLDFVYLLPGEVFCCVFLGTV